MDDVVSLGTESGKPSPLAMEFRTVQGNQGVDLPKIIHGKFVGTESVHPGNGGKPVTTTIDDGYF